MFLDSYTQSITRNWFDQANRKYYHKIAQGILQRRIGQGNWISLDQQVNFWPERRYEQGKIGSVIKVASDNNRVLIQTEDNNLFWRCMIGDAASWVLTAIELAEYVGTADQEFFQFITNNYPDLTDDREDILRILSLPPFPNH